MKKIKREYVLPALVALGLAVPSGVSNKFLPSTLVSSIFDGDRVNMPIISIQSLLLVIYFLLNFKFIRFCASQFIMVAILLFATLVCSFFSIYPAGFISYSTTWLVAPFAVAVHYRFFHNRPEFAYSRTMSMVAYMFLPFYIFDLIVSLHTFGLDGFTSYTLATNGHTFVSMLFVLFIQYEIISGLKKFKLMSSKTVAICVYMVGGIISQGRVALVFMLFATMVFHWRQAKKMFIFTLFFLAGLIALNEKIRVVYDALIAADFQDPMVWSSVISRLSFWDVFFEIFVNNPIAGAGGLSANIIKYDYGFVYPVFVDPHNEFIFIISGFGLSGCLFVFTSVILARSLMAMQLHSSVDVFKPVRRDGVGVILWFVFGCSLTNANSAKQNIEILICLTILLAVSGARKLKSQRTMFLKI